MTSWKANRRSCIRKEITFEQRQWDLVEQARRVENRQRIQAGLAPVGWMRFARQRVMTNRAVEISVPADIKGTVAQLARIGSNINQIAHRVNLADTVTMDELAAVHRELEGARSIVRRMEHDAIVNLEEDAWPM